jgi:hypothetical protein
MTIGLSKLAAVERLTAWATKYTYLQLHVGDPGANGTANIAAENTRVAVTWGTPDDTVAGVVTLTHSNDLVITTAAATEDWSFLAHFSASTAGDFGGSGTITADPITVGSDRTFPAGSVIVTVPVAA